MKHLSIFASGSGTNAERIIQHFKDHPDIRVSLVLSNKEDAYVLQRARNLQVPSFVFNRNQFYNTPDVLKILADYNTNYIILAGFLWLVPASLLENYPGKIINIHPALLPKYGGKGMYGSKVHEAVVANQEKESGITIHYVNSEYDKGDIIFQARCPVLSGDTPDAVASKVHQLEYEHYPRVIEEVVKKIS